jgi:hypothetical protein
MLRMGMALPGKTARVTGTSSPVQGPMRVVLVPTSLKKGSKKYLVKKTFTKSTNIDNYYDSK